MSHLLNSDTSHSNKIKDLSDKVSQLEALLAQRDKENYALTQRLAKFETGLANLRAGMFEWDIDTQQFFISSAPCAALSEQLASDAPPPEYLKNLVSQEAYLIVEAKWLALVNGHSAMEYGSFEARLPGQGKQKLRVYATLHRDATGKPEKIQGFMVIHEPGKWAPDVLEDFDVFDIVPVGIICLDMRSGYLIEANQRARQVLQISQEAIFTDDDPFNKIDWSEITEELEHNELIERKQLEIRLADGSKKWILFSGKSSSGNALYAAILDFTAIKDTITELQKVNFELDNFVYHASHDLRAPLRNVLGLLSLLKQGDSAEERIRCLELIEGTINRLDTLVVDLLSISRNNRSQQRFVKINFMVEINIAISNFYHVGDTKNLEISTKISQPVYYVSDLTRVRIIMNNLVSNAIKYRRPCLDQSFIDIQIWVDKDHAHIEITDNGEGISEEHIASIYDMFYRASEKSEGSGLGLYIVRDVVEKLEGTIEVKSEQNVGTTFTLTLPNYYKPANTQA